MTIGLGDRDADFLKQESSGTIRELAAGQTSMALGPGIGTDPSTMRLVHALYHKLSLPMVVDADGLNAMAEWKEGLKSKRGTANSDSSSGRISSTRWQSVC